MGTTRWHGTINRLHTEPVFKYPRTAHLEGSRLQPGDESLEQVPFERVRGRHLVVEEKLDGANAGISFGPDGDLLLQSRGHYLTGGPRERQFTLFKSWAATHSAALRAALTDRYVLFGEWLYARHTVFYDALPHYFLEFDVLDLNTGEFLATPQRAALLEGLPVRSVPVLAAQAFSSLAEVLALLGQSTASSTGVPMEGLYLKVEEDGRVVERYKWVQARVPAGHPGLRGALGGPPDRTQPARRPGGTLCLSPNPGFRPCTACRRTRSTTPRVMSPRTPGWHWKPLRRLRNSARFRSIAGSACG